MARRRTLPLLACGVALVGLALRLVDFGRWSFWTDEAWVAIATRVEGWRQFLLALCVTPLGWGALLKPLALAAPPEVSLRLLPLAASLLTLWLAWRLGRALAGHALGGLLALALVALDPTSIAWAKQLKPYSAEAALALLAFLAADRVARRRRDVDVVRLSLVLALGVTFSNAQLILAPPLFAVLAAGALRRGDRRTLHRLGVAAAGVALWDLLYFALVMRPWLTPALRAFWTAHYLPRENVAAATVFLAGGTRRLLAPCLGPHGPWLALGALGVLLVSSRGRAAAAALLVVFAEVATLSGLGLFPFGVPRTGLFLSTLLLVSTGAAAGRVTIRLWTRRGWRPLALATPVLLALAVALGRTTSAPYEEDLGPLIGHVERERRPGDRILLYSGSLFVWGYYKRTPPVLLPAPSLANGFLVAVDDPAVVLVRAGAVTEEGINRASTAAPRVWFVGSRFASGDAARIRAALAAQGRVVIDERRPHALLLLVERR